MSNVQPNVIAHYGVLGMKWGVRKDGKPQGYQGRKGGSKKTRTERRIAPSQDHVRARQTSRKNIAELSNEELKLYNERLRLELEYSRLHGSDSKFKGQEFLTNQGNRLLNQVIGSVSGALIQMGLNYVFKR